MMFGVMGIFGTNRSCPWGGSLGGPGTGRELALITCDGGGAVGCVGRNAHAGADGALLRPTVFRIALSA